MTRFNGSLVSPVSERTPRTKTAVSFPCKQFNRPIITSAGNVPAGFGSAPPTRRIKRKRCAARQRGELSAESPTVLS